MKYTLYALPALRNPTLTFLIDAFLAVAHPTPTPLLVQGLGRRVGCALALTPRRPGGRGRGQAGRDGRVAPLLAALGGGLVELTESRSDEQRGW